MTVSTDGILIYGIAYDDEEHPGHADDVDSYPWDDEQYDRDFETWYCQVIGGIEYPSEEQTDRSPLLDNYWQRCREFMAALPIGVSDHCSGEYPLLYVAVKAAEFVAHRGYPKRIEGEALRARPEWNEQIRAFCERVGLPYYPPGWYLVSYWG